MMRHRPRSVRLQRGERGVLRAPVGWLLLCFVCVCVCIVRRQPRETVGVRRPFVCWLGGGSSLPWAVFTAPQSFQKKERCEIEMHRVTAIESAVCSGDAREWIYRVHRGRAHAGASPVQRRHRTPTLGPTQRAALSLAWARRRRLSILGTLRRRSMSRLGSHHSLIMAALYRTSAWHTRVQRYCWAVIERTRVP
jgi:hypothetical protein